MQFKDVLTSKEQRIVLKRLMSYLNPFKTLFFLAIGIAVLSIVFDLLGPVIIKYVIDNYIESGNIVMEGIIMCMVYYSLAMIFYAIFKYLQTYQFNKLGYLITKQIRDDVFEKVEGLGMRFFDQTPAGSIVSRITNDTDAIQEMLINVLAVIFTSIILVFGIIIAMFMMSPVMALICVAFLPVAVLLVYVYQKMSTKYYMIAREKMSQLNTKLAESISGMHIIQIFHQQKRFAKNFEETNEEYYKANMKVITLESLLLAPAINLITSLALVTLYAYTGFQAFAGLASAGLLVAFVEYVYRFFNPLFQIMERLSMLQQAIVSAHRVFVIMDHEELAPMQDADASALISNAKIEFRNVSFSYDGENNVLNNISFTVMPGETIALVGHTGSGKSSIINVMMRLYEFYEGDILIDDQSIRKYPIEELRKEMGLVLQDPFMYYGSINDNVRLKDTTITDEQIRKACEFVQADRFVSQLSDGYEHIVIERGASMSTGQKQLLAFARTVVKDPKILILDEATANVDTETEGLIQEGLKNIQKGRTTIAIAHRLSTIKDANQILVLEAGHIVERGNHDELIAQNGIYSTMYELQKNAVE